MIHYFISIFVIVILAHFAFLLTLEFHVLVSQEGTAPEPPQNNRARRRRVRRVWNGEAFVPEVRENIIIITVKWLFYTVECLLIEQIRIFHYLNIGKNGAFLEFLGSTSLD